jgi:hypothetical protein
VFTSVVEDTDLKDINALTPKEFSYLLRELPALKRWATQVSEFALSFMESGGQIPYWGIEEKLGNRKWAVDPDELELYFDTEVLYEPKLRSPAQVEKLAGKHSVDEFTVREVTGNTIVKTDDPNEANETTLFTEVDD